jgi:pimeloyl-ACP methyl ester carboxylesterase
MLPVERWIVCVGGFGQDEPGRHGIDEIQDAVFRRCTCESTRVPRMSWRDSPASIAKRIWNRRPDDHPPRVVLIGFSYGGWTAILIARELESLGLDVEVMLLIDAVWRPLAWLPSLTSLLRRWKIRVPENVRCVYSWRQQAGAPFGHEVMCGALTLHTAHTLTAPHQQIDDHPEVFAKALEVACPERKAA